MDQITIDEQLARRLEGRTQPAELITPSGKVVGRYAPLWEPPPGKAEDAEPDKPRIINRGRGPEIEGSRITVYDVLDYHGMGWEPQRIADLFSLSVEQIQAAIDYIESHKGEVMAAYQIILERCARGNPPELQAKLDATHAKYMVLWADRYRRAGMLEDGDEGTPGRH
jgi:uncharacterized protein (DUF433 family)